MENTYNGACIDVVRSTCIAWVIQYNTGMIICIKR